MRVSEAVGLAKVKLLPPLVNDRLVKLTFICPAAPASSLMSRSKMEPVNTRLAASPLSGL